VNGGNSKMFARCGKPTVKLKIGKRYFVLSDLPKLFAVKRGERTKIQKNLSVLCWGHSP
jgi:hypothetical protein